MNRLLLLFVGLLLPSLAWAQSAQIQTAHQYLEQHADRFSIDDAALNQAVVSDAYTSRHSGVTHVYFQQVQSGIEVANAIITVNVTSDGRVLLAGGSFIPSLDGAARSAAPSLSAEAAVNAAVQRLGLTFTEPLVVQQRHSGAARGVTFSDGGVARAPIPAKLVYHPLGGKTALLAWDVQVEEGQHVWTVRVDAASGDVLMQHDQVVHDHWGIAAATDLAPLAPGPGWQLPAVENLLAAATRPARTARAGGSASYRVYDTPLESPNFGERTLVVDPADPIASPDGWHDDGDSTSTYGRGNNVHAYVDANGTDIPNGTDAEPDGGEDLVFDFEIDFTQDPTAYRPAAVTNLFYWSNLIHDVFFQYGFDEAAGNFQTTNYSGEGLGNDYVRAEAQDAVDAMDCPSTPTPNDGPCLNNANFFTPSDGQRPRMQMFLWALSTPRRDGDFDNGIIAHEYGHGVSNRLTAGPSNVGCLQNAEQMGEGWSDYLGLILSMEEGAVGETGRGIGTYVLNQPVTGPGIRPARYSTDLAVNGFTYGDIGGLAVPHGVGFVWATMIWDMTWKLIDVYGFDPDLYEGTGGNNIALQLVMDGMKLQPCNPGFVDGRDAILAADEALYDGVNAPYIWEAFARRGLGYSASQGSSGSSSDGVEAFDLPPGLGRFVFLEATPDPVNNYEFVDYTLTFSNGTARDPLSNVVMSVPVPDDAIYVGGSASNGGTFADGLVTFPAFDAATGSETARTFRLLASPDSWTTLFFADGMENGDANWTAEHGAGNLDWTLGDGNGSDGSAGWFADDISSITDQYLILAEAFSLSSEAELRFTHRYNTESTYDGGVVEISIDDGATWEDLGELMTQNGYNSTISTQYQSPIGGRAAFSGGSGGFITTVADLSEFVGEDILIRFRFATDVSVSGDGWYVDDVEIGTAIVEVNVEACAADTETACAVSRVLVIEPIEPSPAIDVSDDEVALAIEPDGTATVEITIANDGERALDWQIGSQLDEPAAWLSAEPASGTIEVGEEQVVTLAFDAADLVEAVFEELLAVYSNDPENLTTDIDVVMTVGTGVASEDGAAQPGPYALGELFPNPFAARAQFTLEVAQAQAVEVAVYDVMGRTVATLHDGPMAAGTRHGFEVDGRTLASGVYLVRVTGEQFAETRRITLLK